MSVRENNDEVLRRFASAVSKEEPADVVQFGADYFTELLRQERLSGVRSVSQSASPFQAGAFDRGSVAFKSPFSASDPHSRFEDGRDSPSSNLHGLQSHDSFAKDMTGLPSYDPTYNAARRTSISAETFQPDHFTMDWKPENYSEKSGDQLKRLERAVSKNFLFNKLDGDNKRLVINSLQEKSVPSGTTIIKQGDEGDYFYIVESGTVEFYVNNSKVNTSGAGSSFGELALMYNSPRAATVIATTDCFLWTLDRMTFKKILLASSFEKRLMYDNLLKSMPIFTTLTTYERAKLSDALDTKYFEEGDVIIREGDLGDDFYLIEYGEVEVSKKGKGVIAILKDHDYFGEVALLNDLPRQATIKALKKTKVATLGKSGFQRLLGPAKEVLKLQDPTRQEMEQTSNTI